MSDTAQALSLLVARVPKTRHPDATAAELVRKGLPSAVIGRLAKAYGVPIEKIQSLLGLSKATGNRRRASGSALRTVNSDRALRLAQVYMAARSLFGDESKARAWLKWRNPVLRGERPIDVLDTEVGARAVTRLIHQIEHGVYS